MSTHDYRHRQYIRVTMPGRKPSVRKLHSAAIELMEKTVSNCCMMHPDVISKRIQNAYCAVREHLQKTNAEVVDECMRRIEDYVCLRWYDALFCKDEHEEALDLALQTRIRSFHSETHIETCLDLTRAEVQQYMERAYMALIAVNAKQTITDKLRCILDCKGHLLAALKESRGSPASADELLPALILCIMNANPPRLQASNPDKDPAILYLQSNVRFISRFALPDTIATGSNGYYFTCFCSALDYVLQLVQCVNNNKDDLIHFED